MQYPNGRICKIETCDKPLKARGYCVGHYTRLMNGNLNADLPLGAKIKKECSINGCDKLVKTRGWCKTHYQRWHERGTTELLGVKGRQKGFKHSSETIVKIIAKKTGMEYRRHKDSYLLKGRRGEKHHNWKGGVSPERHRAMSSAKYKSWKDTILKRDNYTCQICLVVGVFLHVDHIKKWSEYPELRYEVDNGRTLCVPCHYYVHFKRKMPVGVTWCNFTLTGKAG